MQTNEKSHKAVPLKNWLNRRKKVKTQHHAKSATKDAKFTKAQKEEFLSLIDKGASPRGCWLWSGSLNDGGYGHFKKFKTNFLAHRLSFYFHKHDPIGYFVCHTCDNPRCVNPDHLWLGDPSSNWHDAKSKGRVPSRECESNTMSKLTCKKVKLIKQIYMRGLTPQKKLAARFNISQSAVSLIVRSKRWSSL